MCMASQQARYRCDKRYDTHAHKASGCFAQQLTAYIACANPAQSGRGLHPLSPLSTLWYHSLSNSHTSINRRNSVTFLKQGCSFEQAHSMLSQLPMCA